MGSIDISTDQRPLEEPTTWCKTSRTSTMFKILYLSCLFNIGFALPSPAGQENVKRADTTAEAIPSRITDSAELSSVLSGLKGDATELALGASAVADLLSAIVPAPNPTAIADEISSVASVYKAHPRSERALSMFDLHWGWLWVAFLESASELVLNGLAPQGLINDVIANTPITNSPNNINLRPAIPPVYPSKDANDAPYSQSERVLRSAIYIPPEFSYGQVRPCIFVPGTASTGGSNFLPNLGKVFKGSTYADPVYLNIPNNQLDDLQINSEFVAYAINYISAISGHKNVSVVSWSAGSIDSVVSLPVPLGDHSNEKSGRINTGQVQSGSPRISSASVVIVMELC